MDRFQTNQAFGRKSARPDFGNAQSPLVRDMKQERRAGRQPTSAAETYWPYYIGFGLPGLMFGAMGTFLIVAGAGKPFMGVAMLLFGLPFVLLSFLISSLCLTRVLSSVRGGAETMGNITFLTATNAGFKIGAAIGFGFFLWMTPDVFGDPFTGNPSAKSAIVAQLMLKALGFIGFAGMVGSRLENFARKKVEASLPEAPSRHPVEKPVTRSNPTVPLALKALLPDLPKRIALGLAGLAFVVQFVKMAVLGGGFSTGGAIGLFVFCFLAYHVLRFYLAQLAKVIRGMSGLYGFSIGAN